MIVLSLLEKLERKTSSVILIDLRNVDQRDHARLCFSCVLLVFAFLRAVSPAEMREMSLSLEAGGISWSFGASEREQKKRGVRLVQRLINDHL